MILDIIIAFFLAVGGVWGFPQGEKGKNALESTPLAELESYIHEEDADVAEAVFNALAEYGRAAVPTLVRALTEGGSMARLYACRALEKIGSSAKEAIPFLEEAQSDSYFDVSQAALRALEVIQKAEPTDIEKSPCYLIVSDMAPFLLDSYRFANESDLIDDWAARKHSGEPNHSTCVKSDFNGDGITDYATILLHRSEGVEGFALFTVASQRSESSISGRYEVFPLHAGREDAFGYQIVRDVEPNASLVDEYGSVIPVGEGWLELRPSGSFGFRQCRFGHIPARRLASIDYVLSHKNDAVGSEEKRLNFFWNDSHEGFWRWTICRERE